MFNPTLQKKWDVPKDKLKPVSSVKDVSLRKQNDAPEPSTGKKGGLK